MSFSVFREAVKTTTTRVTFIEGKAGDSWLCDKVLMSLRPGLYLTLVRSVRVFKPSSAWTIPACHSEYYLVTPSRLRYRWTSPDWCSSLKSQAAYDTLQVYAPILVRGPSSFNLWAALANHGQVIYNGHPSGTSISGVFSSKSPYVGMDNNRARQRLALGHQR